LSSGIGCFQSCWLLLLMRMTFVEVEEMMMMR